MNMEADKMLADLTECVAMFATLHARLSDMPAAEQLLLQLALREAAKHAASFCTLVKSLEADGLPAALELLDLELIEDGETDDCRPEELN
jgi:hypothetical protein